MNEVLSDDDLFALAESVWSSILGLELTRADEVDGKIGDTTITSCVQITGDWEGAVTIACSPGLAIKLAAAMFQMEADELGEDEIRDAMGEIANMTGGNVKGLAPGTNTLALPTVTEGDENSLSITKTVRLNRVVAMTEGEPVIITVLGRQA
jgi:chemotaxis protein CheX